MRIGLSAPLEHENAKQWARKLKSLGCGAIVFPLDYTAPEGKIAEYVDAAGAEDLVIAEVGIWKNVLSADTKERECAREHARGQ